MCSYPCNDKVLMNFHKANNCPRNSGENVSAETGEVNAKDPASTAKNLEQNIELTDVGWNDGEIIFKCDFCTFTCNDQRWIESHQIKKCPGNSKTEKQDVIALEPNLLVQGSIFFIQRSYIYTTLK